MWRHTIKWVTFNLFYIPYDEKYLLLWKAYVIFKKMCISEIVNDTDYNQVTKKKKYEDENKWN